jgi:hypothetical protein
MFTRGRKNRKEKQKEERIRIDKKKKRRVITIRNISLEFQE